MADPRFFDRAGPLSLEALAALTGARLRNAADGGRSIGDVAPLESAGPEDVTFLDNRKYLEAFSHSRAGAAFVDERLAGNAPAGMALLVTREPYKAFARAAQAFYPIKPVAPRRAASAIIDQTATVPADCNIGAHVVIEAGVRLGARCQIGPNTVIETGAELGDDCRVGANVTLSHCRIGARVVLHPGVRIGQPGFGFAPDPNGPVKIPQLGRVIIGDVGVFTLASWRCMQIKNQVKPVGLAPGQQIVCQLKSGSQPGVLAFQRFVLKRQREQVVMHW